MGGNQNSSEPVIYYSSDVSFSSPLSMGNPTLFDLSLSCHHSLRLALNHGCLTESSSLCRDESAASQKKVDFKRGKKGWGMKDGLLFTRD